MNRQERRARVALYRKQSQAWPEQLTPVPQSEWPARAPEATEYPVAVWRSRRFLVQKYAAPALFGIGVHRLTVNRVTVQSNGDWEQGITWDDLQQVKRETGHGDRYAVEIYPRERDIVNVGNLRHLWLLDRPLPLGWFEGDP